MLSVGINKSAAACELRILEIVTVTDQESQPMAEQLTVFHWTEIATDVFWKLGCV